MQYLNHRGGMSVDNLKNVEIWEAELITNVRLWCSGLSGRARVYEIFTARLQPDVAIQELDLFERLLTLTSVYAHRPIVHHDVECACIGADEKIFVHLVDTACSGDLREASLIATLLVGAANAEQIALLAAQFGISIKKMVAGRSHLMSTEVPSSVQLH